MKCFCLFYANKIIINNKLRIAWKYFIWVLKSSFTLNPSNVGVLSILQSPEYYAFLSAFIYFQFPHQTVTSARGENTLPQKEKEELGP
jgi:hypothetical protein